MADQDVIILGAGCFWGVEDSLRIQPGVVSTRAGYAGGHVSNPTYEQVCSGSTGHAEAVEVTFDPTRTSLDELLEFFWTHHVATGRNIGQYRSLVVCSPDQAQTVERLKARIAAMLPPGEAITTQILIDAPFYSAEVYHQQYYEKGREVVREVRRQCGLPPQS
jgi:peptide-methionine (S)-S-oxide reductase